jgi:hypothetical protein
MEEGLRIIEMNKEYSSDQAFVCQVRLQLLAQRVYQIREQHALTAITGIPPVPASFYLKVLQGQLQDLKSLLSPHLPQVGK